MTQLFFLLSLCSSIVSATPPHLNMDDAFAEMDEQMVLHFRNAKTGAPVAKAQISFQGRSKYTDSNGTVQFPFPDVSIDETTMYAKFSKAGYVNSDIPITFMAEGLWINHYSVTEDLRVDELRIILDWSSKPADLDAHWAKDNGYHISYRKMKSYEDIAALDRDDRDGNGPETITVHRLDKNATYQYFVHDYSNRTSKKSDAMSKGRAQVLVYSNNGLEEHYRIPTASVGNVWSVFKVQNGKIVQDNNVRSILPN